MRLFCIQSYPHLWQWQILFFFACILESSITYYVSEVKDKMPTELHYADESPRCSECGCPCDDGFIIKGDGQRDPETGYQDLDCICAACDRAEGRYEMADQEYDMSCDD